MMQQTDIQAFAEMHDLQQEYTNTGHSEWTHCFLYMVNAAGERDVTVCRMSLRNGTVESVKWFVGYSFTNGHLPSALGCFLHWGVKLTSADFKEACNIAKLQLEEELEAKEAKRRLLKEKKRPKLAQVTNERIHTRAAQLVHYMTLEGVIIQNGNNAIDAIKTKLGQTPC